MRQVRLFTTTLRQPLFDYVSSANEQPRLQIRERGFLPPRLLSDPAAVNNSILLPLCQATKDIHLKQKEPPTPSSSNESAYGSCRFGQREDTNASHYFEGIQIALPHKFNIIKGCYPFPKDIVDASLSASDAIITLGELPTYAICTRGRKRLLSASVLSSARLPSVSAVYNQRYLNGYHSSAILQSKECATKHLTIPPVPEIVLRKRRQTLKRFQDFVSRKYKKKYKAVPFGSTCYGTDNACSDLDLAILDPDRPTGVLERSTLPAIYDIRLLAKNIRKAGFSNVEAITKAVVPIVRFVDPKTGIKCDVNINDRLAVANTALIQRYCELVPYLRMMLQIIKGWAKPLGLNNPSQAPITFSSYAFTMMTIGFLQMRGLAPNLQENVEDIPPTPESFIWFSSKPKKDEIALLKCDARFTTCPRWTPRQNFEIADMLVQWFQYWAQEHQYVNNAMSIAHGGSLPREQALDKFGNLGSHTAPSTSANSDDPPLRVLEDQETEKKSGGTDAGDAVHSENIPVAPGDVDSPQRERQYISPRAMRKWMGPPLCVGDPFIPGKNLTSNVGYNALEKFRFECRNALHLLQLKR